MVIFTCRDISAGEELCFSYFGDPDEEDETADVHDSPVCHLLTLMCNISLQLIFHTNKRVSPHICTKRNRKVRRKEKEDENVNVVHQIAEGNSFNDYILTNTFVLHVCISGCMSNMYHHSYLSLANSVVM